MDREEQFKATRELILRILPFLEEGNEREAFQQVNSNISTIQNTLVTLQSDQFLTPQQVEDMARFLVQALENKDRVLLEDVLEYALLDVMNQLLETKDEE